MEADILSLLCSTCGAISRLIIALAGNPGPIFSRYTKTPEMTVGLMMTPWPMMHPRWLLSHMLLASLASDSSWFPDSIYNGGDCGPSLPHPDTGIWLRQETFLPNWVGWMAHQPER